MEIVILVTARTKHSQTWISYVVEWEKKTINIFNLCTVESVNKICNVSLVLTPFSRESKKCLNWKSFKLLWTLFKNVLFINNKHIGLLAQSNLIDDERKEFEEGPYNITHCLANLSLLSGMISPNTKYSFQMLYIAATIVHHILKVILVNILLA